MNQIIHYVLADPSGNTTILVLDPIPMDRRASLATRLLQQPLGAEQVGFLTISGENNRDLRVDMMGGEFCGNASRSAAAYVAWRNGIREGVYHVSCSGCSSSLNAKVCQIEKNAYMADIEMPLPEEIEAVVVDVGGLPYRFFRVDFGGIVHFVTLTNDLDQVNRDRCWQAIKSYNAEVMPDALGMVLYEPSSQTMIPAVYVKGTDTLYWEQSCGSGTAAVGGVMACLTKKDFMAVLRQPGGKLFVKAVSCTDGVQTIHIGGQVYLMEKEEILE